MQAKQMKNALDTSDAYLAFEPDSDRVAGTISAWPWAERRVSADRRVVHDRRDLIRFEERRTGEDRRAGNDPWAAQY